MITTKIGLIRAKMWVIAAKWGDKGLTGSIRHLTNFGAAQVQSAMGYAAERLCHGTESKQLAD